MLLDAAFCCYRWFCVAGWSSGACFCYTLLMFYTYILRSIGTPTQRYIGSTTDLKRRLADHNSGNGCFHSKKYAPWKLETYIAFETLEKAHAFELYLKTGSGHEFARRHF